MVDSKTDVLIVDDEDNAWIAKLASALRAHPVLKFEPREAQSIENAEKMCAVRPPDVAVVDLKLRGEHNKPDPALAIWLSCHCPKCRLIIVTDFADTDIPADFLRCAPSAYILKSEGVDAVVDKIASWVPQRLAECPPAPRSAQVAVEDVVDHLQTLAKQLVVWGEMHGPDRLVYACGGKPYTVGQLADELSKGTPVGLEFYDAIIHQAFTERSRETSSDVNRTDDMDESLRIITERTRFMLEKLGFGGERTGRSHDNDRPGCE